MRETRRGKKGGGANRATGPGHTEKGTQGLAREERNLGHKEAEPSAGLPYYTHPQGSHTAEEKLMKDTGNKGGDGMTERLKCVSCFLGVFEGPRECLLPVWNVKSTLAS